MPDLSPPPGLPDNRRHIWQETLDALTEAGTLDRATIDLISAHVEAVATHRRASALLAQTDILTIRGEGAAQRATISPAIAVQKAAAETITRTTRALGLNRRPGQQLAPPRPLQAAEPLRDPAAAPDLPFPGAWRCDRHNWWHGTCRRHGGLPCHGKVPEGLTTCRMHAGRNGKQKHLAAVAAKRRVGGSPVQRHPADALLEEVAYWTGLCAWLDEVVAGLEEEQAVWGMVSETRAEGGEFPGVTVVSKAALNTWVEWQQRAHREKAQVAKWALEAEVDAAALRFQQSQGMQAFRVVQAALAQVGLDQGQWGRMRQVMPSLIRDLCGTDAPGMALEGTVIGGRKPGRQEG